MSKVFAEDYIKKIVWLERRIGNKVGYSILEPFHVDTKDIVAIQSAAKKIAEFIGLHNLTLLVAVAKQKEKVGGHIELKNSDEGVFIEISENTRKFKDSVLATLAHEITHKYLHVNGISSGSGPTHQYENEILTDITAVFLGLGKLILNGYECQDVRTEWTSGSTQTVTETLKTGYLNLEQLAFVYRFVCAMRKIPSTDYTDGLNTGIVQLLWKCEKDYGHYFSENLHNPNVRNELVDHLRSEVRKTQSILSSIDKNLLYIQGACTSVFSAFLERIHKSLMGILLESHEMVDDDEYDLCMRFFNAMMLDRRVRELVSKLSEYSHEATLYQNSVEGLADLIQKSGAPFLPPNVDMFEIIVCRNDGTKLRLPRGKTDLTAKCPECYYQFVADTSILVSAESVPAENKDVRESSGIGKFFRRLFGRQ